MKKKRIQTHSIVRAVILYTIIVILTVVFAMQDLSSLATDYNTRHMEFITGLLAEKMNNTLDYLVGSLEQMSISEMICEKEDPDILYRHLKNYLESTKFISIGMVKPGVGFWGNTGDRLDFEKYNYLEMADQYPGTYLTNPYRSSASGKNVSTIFTVFKEGIFKGYYLYASFPLEVIQEMAESERLTGKTNVFLMNALTQNYISCLTSMDSEEMAGTWNNLMLTKNDLLFDEINGCEEMLEKMRSGVDYDMCTLYKEGQPYTISYQKINQMKDWYVLVEINNNELANLSDYISHWGFIYGGILLAATGLLAVYLFIGERKQRTVFQKLSSTDPLTGLMNRRAFENAIQERFISEDAGVLIFIDIDDFKTVNDRYGHDAGDAVLVYFADQMRRIFGTDSLLGRFGGDEFVAFLENEDDGRTINAHLSHMMREFHRVEMENGTVVPASFSAGAACYPQDETQFEELCKCADEALYFVKGHNKNSYAWYEKK